MKLTVLSFGGGQDSTAIGYRLLYDREFRAKYAPEHLVIVMADTGDEHPETLKHVKFFAGLCKRARIEFVHLTPDMGYHYADWQSLRGQYRKNSTCGSKAFPKSCTDKLKIQPIYKWLSKYVGDMIGWDGAPRGIYRGKWPLVTHAETNGKIRVLLGIAAGEEKRVAGDDGSPKWMRLAIDKVFPLIDLGWDRQACQDYIREAGLPLPMPSNCMLCPFMSEIELLWLERHYPDDYQDWVQIEANKLAANTHKGEKNLGVFGKRALPQVLAEAKVKHSHMSPAEIDEYKQSHGHCVKSRY